MKTNRLQARRRAHAIASSNRPMIVTLALAGVISLPSVAAFAAPASAPPIYVNGERTNVPAVVRHSQVFVPIRGVFEKLGANVAYTPPRSVVAKKSGADLVNLQLGSRAALVNGSSHQLQSAPFLSGARIFVPLRLISQAAGATVAYTTNPYAVRITKGRAALAAPVAAAAPAEVAAPVAEHRGLPWWLWPLLILLALGLLVALLRRRKPDPIIATRSSPSDPTINTRR